MSLWWANREQLDDHQVRLIEDLPLRQNHLVLGPPGSGKTNVLLRRAQFVRMQDMPNVLVLTFTRSLTEFMRTGCYGPGNRELFPPKLITTVESWLRSLYDEHEESLPEQPDDARDLAVWKRLLADGASGFRRRNHLPRYEAIFVDEAQDLLPEEVALIAEWGETLFFVGDDKQRIYGHGSGLPSVRQHIHSGNEHTLQFHYRVAPELSQMADRILQSTGRGTLASTGHYGGPKPGRITAHGPMSDDEQLAACAERLRQQLRVYSDFINQGDRLGVVVAYKNDRERVHEYLERQPDLAGMSKIIRARDGTRGERYDPSFDSSPISIVSVQGCKGLEFRSLHWLFSESNAHHHSTEHYYTVVTRAKTSLDLYFGKALPEELARAHAPTGGNLW